MIPTAHDAYPRSDHVYDCRVRKKRAREERTTPLCGWCARRLEDGGARVEVLADDGMRDQCGNCDVLSPVGFLKYQQEYRRDLVRLSSGAAARPDVTKRKRLTKRERENIPF